MKAAILAAGLSFAATLALVAGDRLPAIRLEVIAGVALGVAVSVPGAIMILAALRWLAGRRRQAHQVIGDMIGDRLTRRWPKGF